MLSTFNFNVGLMNDLLKFSLKRQCHEISFANFSGPLIDTSSSIFEYGVDFANLFVAKVRFFVDNA